jgi:hypothetical protein
MGENATMSRYRPQELWPHRIPLAGALAAALVVAVNLALRYVGVHLLGVPHGFVLLAPWSVVAVSVVAVVAATASLALFERRATRALSAQRRLAVVALMLSLAGSIAAVGRAPHMSHLSAGTLATMLLMQVASAVCVMSLTDALGLWEAP